MRYIILHGPIFPVPDWQRYGCDLLSERGYEVEVLELVDILYPEVSSKVSNEEYRSHPNARRVASFKELDAYLASIRQTDLVLCNFHASSTTLPVFRLLDRHAIDYAMATLSIVPFYQFNDFGSALNLREYVHIKSNDLISAVLRIGAWCRIWLDWKAGWARMKGPRWWLRAGDRHARFNMVHPKLWQAEVIDALSFDAAIAASNPQRRPAPSEAQRPYAVFLDEGFVDHPDFKYVPEAQQPVTPEKYTAAIARLFDMVERDLGLDIIIALHPKMQSAETLQVYKKHEIVAGQTAALIADADLTIATCSTAIGYAVYFNKPTLLVTTTEIERDTFFHAFAARMSSWLGQKRIILDELPKDARLSVPRVRESQYKSYLTAFMKGKKATDAPAWKVLAERFESALTKMASDSGTVKPPVSAPT